MKKLYMYALLVLSFGMLNQKANAQTQAGVDSVKVWTDDFLKNAKANDPELRIDTVWVDDADAINKWGNFGRYKSGTPDELPVLVIGYLASRMQDVELQNKITLANGIVPGVYNHEDGHRKKRAFIYGNMNFAWSMYDSMQKLLSDEFAQRLSESFSIRTEVLNKKLSPNMLKNIANNLPENKLYNKDYFLWLANNKVSKEINTAEANMMLASVINWTKTANTDIYNESAASMASYYRSHAIARVKDQKAKVKLMDFDSFITGTFKQVSNGTEYNIFDLADKETVDKFLRTIAKIMKQYEPIIKEQDSIHQKARGKSIEILNNKYKKDVKKHSQSTLRAEKLIDR